MLKCTEADIVRFASGSYASLALRVGEIRRVASDPGSRARLEWAVRSMRNPKVAARILNLRGHPDLRVRLGLRKENKLEAALGRVIYSLDPTSQFTQYDAGARPPLCDGRLLRPRCGA